MRALRVVEPDPVIDDPFCLEAVSDFMQIDGLLFLSVVRVYGTNGGLN